MRDRKQYMKTSYAKYWINARNLIYGTMPYDLSMIDKIDEISKKNSVKKILEVAIGTGDPIAADLLGKGYQMSGVDISEILIAKCKENYPKINAIVGDAENIKLSNGSFDLVYCLHSAWLIPNFNRAISEMLRVVKKKGGVVIFDIQNSDNKSIQKIYYQHIFENKNLLGMAYKTFKNSAKLILRKGTQDWPFIVSQTPQKPSEMIDAIDLSIEKIKVFGVDGNGVLKKISNDQHRQYQRLVFIVEN
mgnify:FL=1